MIMMTIVTRIILHNDCDDNEAYDDDDLNNCDARNRDGISRVIMMTMVMVMAIMMMTIMVTTMVFDKSRNLDLQYTGRTVLDGFMFLAVCRTFCVRHLPRK